MDIGFMIDIFPVILSKLPVTLYIFTVTAVISLVLGVLMAFVELKRVPVLKQIFNIYSSFVRSTPGIVHIFIVYYGLPVFLAPFGISPSAIDRLTSSIVALVFYTVAFISAVIKPSIKAMPQSQFDAAASVGMTRWQSLRRIIIPQLVPMTLPSLTNAMVDLLMDTSLLFTIGLTDLMGQANILVSNTLGINQVEIFVTVALIYWALSSMITAVMRFFEKRLAHYLR